MEQSPVYNKINFNVGIGASANAQVSQTSLTVHLCPSDATLQQTFRVYDSSFGSPIATIASSNYVASNGWAECFDGAGGNPQPDDPGDPGVYGMGGTGMFFRNSKVSAAKVSDGLSNTIAVGERSSNHAPATWTGAITGGRCPAWMADLSPAPYSSPPGAAYDNADFGEALILAHGNDMHLPNVDFPIYDPDVFYSFHVGGAQFLMGDGSVRFISSYVNGATYQALNTIGGGEVLGEF
jgi:prepilin-type processing-associated H-X9-DG protein